MNLDSFQERTESVTSSNMSFSDSPRPTADGASRRSFSYAPCQQLTNFEGACIATNYHQSPNNRKRSYSNDSSQSERPAKRSMFGILASGIKGIWDYACRKDISHSEEAEAITPTLRELCDQIRTLELTLAEERRQHKQKESSQSEQYHVVERDHEALKADLSELQSTALSLLEAKDKDAGVYHKVPDDQISSQWQTLAFNIRGFVFDYLTEHPDDENEALNSYIYGQRAASPEEITHLRSSILQRELWRIICHHVFFGMWKDLAWNTWSSIGATSS